MSQGFEQLVCVYPLASPDTCHCSQSDSVAQGLKPKHAPAVGPASRLIVDSMLNLALRKQHLARIAQDTLKALRATAVVALPEYQLCAQQRRSFAAGPSFEYEPDYSKKHDIVRKSGVDVLHDPLYNKASRYFAMQLMLDYKCRRELTASYATSCNRELDFLTPSENDWVSEACCPLAHSPWKDR